MLSRNQQLFDNLQIYDTVLQLMTFLQTAGDPTNADVIERLEEQNKQYLKKIVKQNNEILSMLEQSISTPK